MDLLIIYGYGDGKGGSRTGEDGKWNKRWKKMKQRLENSGRKELWQSDSSSERWTSLAQSCCVSWHNYRMAQCTCFQPSPSRTDGRTHTHKRTVTLRFGFLTVNHGGLLSIITNIYSRYDSVHSYEDNIRTDAWIQFRFWFFSSPVAHFNHIVHKCKTTVVMHNIHQWCNWWFKWNELDELFWMNNEERNRFQRIVKDFTNVQRKILVCFN